MLSMNFIVKVTRVRAVRGTDPSLQRLQISKAVCFLVLHGVTSSPAF